MSTYTTEVRYICESKSGFSEEQLLTKTIDEIISASRANVFNFDFPVYEEAFRSVLESTILLHFYTREIGAETVGLWQHYLCRKLREIMPRYNKLFLSALLEYNPLYDVDYTRTHEGDSTGDKRGTHSRTGNGSAIHANTVVLDGTTATTDNGTVSETDEGTTTTSNSDTRTENVTTTGEKDGTRNGTKTTHDTHEKNNDHRDYYSDTPMAKVEGVNGIPVPTQTGDETLGYNFYLTDYRKIKDSEDGENNGSETQSETTHEETEGTSRTTSTGSATGNGTTENERHTTTANTGRVKTDNETTDSGTTTTTDSENGNTTEVYTNTDDYVEHIVGKMGTGSYAAMITEYRETIINYMELLLNELEPLFMNIW